jgi:hypothetical protein
MSPLIYSLRNFVLPVLLHLLIIGAYSRVDPCNDNPGCMAGSASLFFVILVSAPTIAILVAASLVQLLRKGRNYTKYLLINSAIAVFPYIAIYAILTVNRLF